MNIAQAKVQISNAMRAYFARDEYGDFIIPPEEQRPVFLMGPPGIGKTAIMKQIASELGVGLVAYSMTHHTRQSALGLPVITSKTYRGEEYRVTEYTMSEIISSVYDMIEDAGAEQGILFLDEINCVSETLTPTMLQFLQYKVFGKHSVPGGWIVVTAGNPPEYNKSAREFDIVTWDRLKRIDIEPDYSAWKEYALKQGVHASITSYLDVKKQNFYKVEFEGGERHFVTARGWTDLSVMIRLYESLGIAVDRLLISQYIQDAEVSADFADYYDLYNKYRSDYKIEIILSGDAPEEIVSRASLAPFDERLSLISLLLEKVTGEIRNVIDTEDFVSELLPLLRDCKAGAPIEEKLREESDRLIRDEKRGALSSAGRRRYERVIAFLSEHVRRASAFEDIRDEYESAVRQMKSDAATCGRSLENLFAFSEKVWPDGQELLIIVTELTAGWYTARFISRYGCDAYYRHNDELKFYERQTEIIRQLRQLDQSL